MTGIRLPAFAWIAAAAALLSPLSERESHGVEPAIVTNSIKMRLVEIPAGSFLMGSEEDPVESLKTFPNNDPSWQNAELPRHKVKITRPFLMGQTEVTLNQFLIFYHDAKYKIEAETDGEPSWGFDKEFGVIESIRFRPWDPIAWKPEMTHPVIYVTWNDAVAFCDWLSQKEGQMYQRYSYGDDPTALVRHANVADASRFKALYPNSTDAKVRSLFVSGTDGYVWTAPVAKFLPNGFGLFDMHGNAWEWCSDWYDEEYYESAPPEDPEGPDDGMTHVLRGGGFFDAPFHQRCARRHDALPEFRDYGTSFRVVRER